MNGRGHRDATPHPMADGFVAVCLGVGLAGVAFVTGVWWVLALGAASLLVAAGLGMRSDDSLGQRFFAMPSGVPKTAIMTSSIGFIAVIWLVIAVFAMR